MRMQVPAVLLIMALSAVLVGCAGNRVAHVAASSSQNPAPAVTQHTFVDVANGFLLTWKDHFTRLDKAPHAYLLSPRWRIDAKPNDVGTLVGVWQLQGSNQVTAAALRYGVNDSRDSLASCLQPGGGHSHVQTSQVMIGGRPFTHYQLHEAGMSHYMRADAYRSRYQGHCYAIDLVIHGTNPQVYDPPRKPPFTQKQAHKALHKLLLRVRWQAHE